MKELSSADITSLLASYYPIENQRLIEHIKAYMQLLLKWNRKISLTRITEPAEIVKFHFGESLLAASALKISDGRLADVGSGAGFPGLPLAMSIPDLRATLVESNGKKAAFLLEVVRRLDLSNVVVIRSRMEDVQDVEAFDFICARALGKHANLIRWSREKLTAKGRLVLFLGEEDVQRVRATNQWTWELPIKVPNSSQRFILYGAPVL